MVVNSPNVKQIKVYNNKEAKVLKKLLFEDKGFFSFTPIQLLMISIGFIFVVYMLHVLIKIFPLTSPAQILVAILVLIISAIVSFFFNKS